MYLWDSGDSRFALFLSWNNFRLVQTLLTTEFPTESTYSCSSGVLQNHRKSVKIKPWASQVLLTEDFVHTSPWFSTHILSGLLWRLSSRVVARNWLFSFLYSMDTSSWSPGEGHGVLPCKEGSVYVYYWKFFCTESLSLALFTNSTLCISMDFRRLIYLRDYNLMLMEIFLLRAL